MHAKFTMFLKIKEENGKKIEGNFILFYYYFWGGGVFFLYGSIFKKCRKDAASLGISDLINSDNFW